MLSMLVDDRRRRTRRQFTPALDAMERRIVLTELAPMPTFDSPYVKDTPTNSTSPDSASATWSTETAFTC